MLLLWVDGWDPAGQQGVHVGPDLVGLCAREGVKDAPAPGKKSGKSQSQPIPRQLGQGLEQPGIEWDEL